MFACEPSFWALTPLSLLGRIHRQIRQQMTRSHLAVVILGVSNAEAELFVFLQDTKHELD